VYADRIPPRISIVPKEIAMQQKLARADWKAPGASARRGPFLWNKTDRKIIHPEIPENSLLRNLLRRAQAWRSKATFPARKNRITDDRMIKCSFSQFISYLCSLRIATISRDKRGSAQCEMLIA